MDTVKLHEAIVEGSTWEAAFNAAVVIGKSGVIELDGNSYSVVPNGEDDEQPSYTVRVFRHDPIPLSALNQ